MQTFRNRRNAAMHLPAPLGVLVYELVDMIGTAGISSDEEVETLLGQGRQYAIFEKPWRPSALIHLYRHLDLIHAATRNPNGNPIRTRHRTHRVRRKTMAPIGLPIDCYDPLYITRCTRMERTLLQAKPRIGLDDLLLRVQELDPL